MCAGVAGLVALVLDRYLVVDEAIGEIPSHLLLAGFTGALSCSSATCRGQLHCHGAPTRCQWAPPAVRRLGAKPLTS
jgi:hypothetical protein